MRNYTIPNLGRVLHIAVLLYGTLFSCALCYGGDESRRSSPLTFIHVSDTHLCKLDGLDRRFIEKRKQYGQGYGVWKRFLETVPRKVKADAVAITGDLIDFYEAQTGNGTMRAEEIRSFAKLVRSSSLPLWLALGNHDLGSYWFEGDDYLNGRHNTQKARAAWIRNVPCFENGTWYSLIRRIGAANYRMIFLENGYREDGIPGDLVDQTQLAWLQWQLAQGKEDTNIILMHIPLPVGDTNGDGIRFSPPPGGWPFPDTYQRGLMRVLNENPSVVALLVGHQHRNVIEDIPFPAGHRITQIQTGNLQVDPKNWRVVRLTENEVSVSSPGSSEETAWNAPSRLSLRKHGPKEITP